MVTNRKGDFNSSTEMLEWQYFQILGELQELQRHDSDPTCPCRLKDLGENCLAKHSLGLSVLAAETALMDMPNRESLENLSMESKGKHEAIKGALCQKKAAPEISNWARQWRKKIEPMYYACSTKKAKLSDAAAVLALMQDPGAVRIAGKCDSGTCSIKVSASEKVERSTSSPAAIGKLIQEVEKSLEQKRTGPGKTANNKTFAMGITDAGKKYDFEWRIVEGADLIVSNDPFTFEANPKYPREIQPRSRDRAATQLQVRNIAANLNPDQLLVDFLSIDKGSPIVGPDLIVECGNGRVMGILRAAKDNPDKYEAYRAKLKEAAPAYGHSAALVDKMKVPVLVRVRLSKVDRKSFAEECNARTTIQSSAIENARTDAEKITPEMLNGLDVLENETIEAAIRSTRNKPFVVSFLNKLPANEQAGLVDSKGVLSQEGVRRIVMAIFVAVFNGQAGITLGEKFFEATDSEVKSVFQGLLRSLAVLARAETMVTSGAREKEYAFGEDLAKVVTVYSRIKATPDYTVSKYLAQQSLEGRELDPFQERVLQVLDGNARSGKRIGQILSAYGQAVIDSPPPGQAGFFAGAKLSKAELFESAVRKSMLAVAEDVVKLMDTCQRTPNKYHYLTSLFNDEPETTGADLSDVASPSESKLDEVLQKLEKGVKSIQESEVFIDFMQTMAKFHNYSLGNIILIMLQRPEATNVAGFNTWKDLGRYVKKGEHGISILAPCWNTKPRKVKVTEKDPETGEEKEVEKTVYPAEPDTKYFKVVTVFDYTQTDGKDIPKVDVPVLQGESTKKLFDKAVQFANGAGIPVRVNDKPEISVSSNTMGYWTPSGRYIWVRSNVPQDQQTKTLLHEIAHALAELRGSRNAETMAESVAYTVANHYGFDTGARSFPYVAIWSEDTKTLKANLEIIRKVAGDMISGIDKLASLEDRKWDEEMPDTRPSVLIRNLTVRNLRQSMADELKAVKAYQIRVKQASGDAKTEAVYGEIINDELDHYQKFKDRVLELNPKAKLEDYSWIGKKLKKCNLTESDLDLALNWRPLRDMIAWALGAKKPVELCQIGMEKGILQLTIRDLHEKPVLSEADVEKIAKTVPHSKRVYTQEDAIVYEITIPQSAPADILNWTPQEVMKPRGERGEQAALFENNHNGFHVNGNGKISKCMLAKKKKFIYAVNGSGYLISCNPPPSEIRKYIVLHPNGDTEMMSPERLNDASVEDPELAKVADALKKIETATLSDVREHAVTICVDPAGQLHRGSSASGTISNVSIPVKCACDSQRPVALLHNHPSEIPVPSKTDMDTARKFNVAMCVKTSAGIRCFQPN